MQEVKPPLKRLQPSVTIARLGIQARHGHLRASRLQDGRIQTKVGNKLIDFARVVLANESQQRS